MNAKLEKDRKKDLGLFGKDILICEMEYLAEFQLEILGIIWKYLSLKITIDEQLFFLNDWHRHDGHISKEEKISKMEFERILTNSDMILQKRDSYVYDTVYDESESFMLSWWCDYEDDDGIYCDFSLILSDAEELIKVKELIQENVFSEGLIITGAKKHFDKSYAG